MKKKFAILHQLNENVNLLTASGSCTIALLPAIAFFINNGASIFISPVRSTPGYHTSIFSTTNPNTILDKLIK